MPLDEDKLDELMREGSGREDTTIELEGKPVREWTPEIHTLMRDTRDIDDIYSLMKSVPGDNAEYRVCMEFLQLVQREARNELAVAILEFHGIPLPDLPQKEGKDGHDPDVLGGGHPL